MKILQLNTWMGKVEGNLQRFFENNDFDIICLQEVMSSESTPLHLSRLCFSASRIVAASKMPYVYFSPNWSSNLADGSFELGNLILSKIPFVSQETHFVNGEFIKDVILKQTPSNSLNVQIVTLENGIAVVNHHGFWRKDPLGDEDSLKSFQNLAKIIKPFSASPLVLCGDLNIIHDSPAMRPLDFLTDLTHENHIDNTLSGLKFNGKVACDHIMINEKLSAKSFAVLDNLISDHLALTAEIEIAGA